MLDPASSSVSAKSPHQIPGTSNNESDFPRLPMDNSSLKNLIMTGPKSTRSSGNKGSSLAQLLEAFIQQDHNRGLFTTRYRKQKRFLDDKLSFFKTELRRVDFSTFEKVDDSTSIKNRENFHADPLVYGSGPDAIIKCVKNLRKFTDLNTKPEISKNFLAKLIRHGNYNSQQNILKGKIF